MKNKTITVVLILLIGIIWGLIIFKINGTMIGNKSKHHKKIISIKNSPATIEDNYELHEYQRDPFLSVLTDTITEIVPEIQVKKVKPRIQRPLILPRYYGLIQNGKEKVAILKINKRTYIVHENDKVESYTIASIHPTYLSINFDGNKIILPLDSGKQKMNKK